MSILPIVSTRKAEPLFPLCVFQRRTWHSALCQRPSLPVQSVSFRCPEKSVITFIKLLYTRNGKTQFIVLFIPFSSAECTGGRRNVHRRKKYRLRAKAEPVMKRKDYSASAAGAGPKAIGVAPVMASLASRVMVTSSMLRVLNSAL